MFEKIFEKYNQIIFFDTETTGFHPERLDQIIELAAISIDKTGRQQEMDEFIKLFRVQELPQQITELTGISSDTLSVQGKDEFAVLNKFIDMIQGNGKGWMQVFNDCDYLDTLTVYKDRRQYPHRLESAIVQYHLINKVKNSHRAIDDCRALIEVTRCMYEEREDLDRYVNLFGFNPRYGPDEKKLKKVTYVSQSMDAYLGRPLYETIKKGV